MKKKNLMTIFSIIAAACTALGSAAIKVSANDTSKRYANLFSYNNEEISVQENYSVAGLDEGRAGLLVSSKNSGNAAEGATISYNGIMSGAFEMDFRVFSEKSYEAKDASKTYTHTAIGWNSNNVGNSINYYADDTFNPYLDLKEVGITFTSTLDSSQWFTVYVRGGYAGLRADLTSVRVETSADNPEWPYALKGYGLCGNDGWPYASWDVQNAANGTNYTMLGSSFSNTNITSASPSAMIKFDPETMSIYGYNGGWGLVRNVSANTGLHTFNDWFGSLDANYFTYGYTVDVTFTDVTANETVGTNLADSDAGYNNVADAGYKAFDAAYERYANMVIYSFGGTSMNDSGPSVKVTNSAATIDGVTLDSAKFDNSANAVHLTTDKTGDEAEGTKFYVNETFNNTFEMDFRVFSQKNYTPKDASKTYTHTAIGWNNNNLGTSINYYKDDVFNPYLDLKEVGIKFTSATDTSKWFIVYVRGGYADLRADMSSARVYTSTDNPDWPYALKGYGLVGGDGWPYASWDPNAAKGCSYTMMGSSFSNTYINGESPSTMIKFDPTAMTVYGYNSGWSAIRDLAGNYGLHTFNDGTWFGTLSAADFAGGYTVEIEFTDMTSNTTAGNSLVDSDVGYNNGDAAYKTFTDTYARYANMYVYGIKSGDVTLDNANLISAEITTKKPVVSANYNKVVTDGQSLDVTPVIYDINLGNIAYNGTVTWMNLADETRGEIVANEGKYIFTPASNGTYLIFYSSMTAENVLATDSFAVAVVAAEHNYGAWINEVPATCVENGVKGHYTCSVCEKNFDAEYAQMTDLTIAAGAEYHNYGEWIAEVSATCVDNGAKAHYHCVTCEQNFDAEYTLMADLTIAASEEYHEFGEWVAEVPASCTEAGIKGYQYCRYCEQYCDAEGAVIENIIIPAAHTYGEWIAEVPATCTEAGVKGYQYCSVCEKNYDADGVEIVDLTIAALEHTDADENGICDACEASLKSDESDSDSSDEPTNEPSDEPSNDTSDSSEPAGDMSDVNSSADSGCFGSINQSAFVIVFVMALACLLMTRDRKENY